MGVFPSHGRQPVVSDGGGRMPAKKGRTKWVVLNDTTLLWDHPSIGRDTFYFHYLPVKPDSTNRFIKPSLKK